MGNSFGQRISHAWNAFLSKDADPDFSMPEEYSYINTSYRPGSHLPVISRADDVVSSIYSQLSVDAASYEMRHIKVDSNGVYKETVYDGLTDCLTVSANIDQTGRAFMQDLYLSLFEDGVAAIVPVDTTLNPARSESYDIKSLRVGRVVGWLPDRVRVEVYNEKTGRREEVVLLKSYVAIVENPLYRVMNEPNGTLKRLLDKMALLDASDAKTASTKLDLIIQLPYVIKSESRREQAEKRRRDIEWQLSASKYGIAYTDGTERITQLNRPVENSLKDQVEYLTNKLFKELGLTEAVFDGTADERTMINYYNRTIEPVLSAVSSAMHRTFLTKTARTQGHAIWFHRDPFRLVPVGQLAEIADKFTRNEILTSNEIRALVGFKPSDEPNADRLQNSNLYPTQMVSDAPIEVGSSEGDLGEETTEQEL